ncbi:MAG: tRNA (N(6)-L-threonylcarbamoyladenosine(37)-C(2))-methylthiotransferase [Euryarchaeota archaeon]|nr:tRNA (N(6)-L-threonylcarbamoyladenosine(37)-C(2))-methylthiotransferase [Euryarchaeota archaeon]MDE1835100.1 tRNA (N(6)-L-threonylcarbamoyladenosine(37)-C(2))-methylthiotransferase [Euryarchaeota archaeon]MDE1879372.1 tRNA (N(6)-L-threonylcarbamoyladenosine(37)-C(2))-methylthiotransferase [Euryarchaeota archaeon]MDE2044937.1 tRNA (N(6)-L-threonylcarbamoyladenosine(37)-C(2))-methylthiotransferase [Thermoplasmata archaeon]
MRVYVEAYGCAQNLGEAEALRALATSQGHLLADRPSEADVGVLVTCAVIGHTEDHMVERWRELSSVLPHTVVTGCMVPLRQERLTAPGARGTTHLLPIRAQEKLPELLRSLPGPGAVAAPPVGNAEHGGLLQVRPKVPPAEATVHRELVLAQGCTSHCTYCFSRLARGPLKSTPLPHLLAQARAAIAGGAVELRVSSLDTSCWGEDLGEGGPRLPEAVRELSALPAPKDFRLRVGMMSPQTLSTISEPYFEALSSLPRMFRFLHLPVQSGSDRVLSAMKRGYAVETFLRLVARARELVPDLMLSTDVIVGFPGERPEDHESTLRLLESVRPEVLNLTRFSPRPMTPAARWEPIVSRVVKERSREVTALRLRLARGRMERWVGWKGRGVVTEHGPEGTCVARMPNYLPVVLPERRPLGTWLDLTVRGARSTYLLGES